MLPELRSEFADIPAIIEENIELVKDAYKKAFESLIYDDSTGEDNFIGCCTLVAAFLVSDETEMTFPIKLYEEDEKLILEVTNTVYSMLTLYFMADKGILKKEVIDGEVYFSIADEKKNG